METSTNEIVKAAIKKDCCIVSFKEDSTTKNCGGKNTKECEQIVHADLRKAFNRLVFHLIVFCEQPEASQITIETIHDLDLADFSNYVVTGYSIGGSDENAGVTIIGQKLLKTGAVLNLISPFIKFEDLDAYPLAGELYNDVQGCNYEVEEYLFNGKWGIKQQEIDFDAPAETDEFNITISDGSGKKGRKVNMKKFKELAEAADELEMGITGTN